MPTEPSDLVLRDLTDAELARYLPYLEQSYADEMHRLGGVSEAVAREDARASTLQLFPDGRPVEGHHLWRAEDGEGRPVGLLWLAHRQPGTGREHAYVYDIEIDADRRGEGWGRRLLERAEAIAREWRAPFVQLNVFGDNEVARGLYRSAGYREQQVTMTKRLQDD
jgi:ribosomal protein S18 acetylase RimI-like enzyme